MQTFDDWPDRYARWFESGIGRLVKRFELDLTLELLQPRPGETILDAGCGSGIVTAPIIERGVNVVGIDLSEPMLHHARDTLPAAGFSPLAADIRALPFTEGRFDRVVSITALEFVAEGQQAMNELFRVTRPGGRVVVATLNRLSPWARRRESAARSIADSVFRHASFRSPDELAGLAPVDGDIRTAIHFAKDADPREAEVIERDGAARGLTTGAFVIGAWERP